MDCWLSTCLCYNREETLVKYRNPAQYLLAGLQSILSTDLWWSSNYCLINSEKIYQQKASISKPEDWRRQLSVWKTRYCHFPEMAKTTIPPIMDKQKINWCEDNKEQQSCKQGTIQGKADKNIGYDGYIYLEVTNSIILGQEDQRYLFIWTRSA